MHKGRPHRRCDYALELGGRREGTDLIWDLDIGIVWQDLVAGALVLFEVGKFYSDVLADLAILSAVSPISVHARFGNVGL